MVLYNIVLCSDNCGGISKDNSIPWKINEDSQYFRDLISKTYSNKKNIFIMGRKTYEQMKNLIKDNIPLVVTHQNINNINTINNLDDIDNKIKELIDTNNIYKVFVLGGASLYNYFFDNYSKYDMTIYWNLINKDYKCDNFIHEYIYEIFKAQSFLINTVIIYCIDLNINETIELTVHRPFNLNKTLQFKELKINEDEENYLRLMRKLLENGIKEECRNGFTRSLFGNILEFNLNKFPLLTTKKTFLTGIFEELMFFIKGQTNANILNEKGVKIWDKNTSRSFLDKCGLTNYEVGDMGPMYGYQWRYFNAEYTGMNGDYTNKGYDQLSYVLDLLKTDPKSRRIIMTTYNPSMAKQGVLFPCHGVTIMFHTNFIADNILTLDIMQTQRSCDYFLGVPFNIASYSLLVYMICHVLNNDESCKYKYKPGKLVINLGDYHLYEEHLEQAKRQILRVPQDFPTLNIKNKVLRLEDFKLEDIELLDYHCYAGIKADMIE